MNWQYNLIIPALLAALLTGCGGGGAGAPSNGIPTGGTPTGGTPTGGTSTGGTSTDGASGGSTYTGGAALTWRSVKWGGGGYVTGLIYHPTSANVLYTRTDVGGAYRWNQTTSQWVPLNDGLGFGAGEGEFHGAESIALDPTNDKIVYMTAGLGNNDKNRLYTSSDRGDTWTWVSLPFVVNGNGSGRGIGERLQVDPAKPSTMYYGSRSAGLWKSTDSGHTWAQVTSLSSFKMSSIGVGVEQIMLDNANVGGGEATSTMWVAIAPDYVTAAGLTSVLYKSSNGGASWAPAAVPTAVVGYHIPHTVRTADGNYYVVFNKGAGPGGEGPGYLYRYSGVNGGTWTLLSSSSWGGYGGVSVYGTGASARIALAVTNTWGDYVGQQVTQLSDNGGATWREIEAQMPHTPASGQFWGWNDDVKIDPSNRDHIMHVFGGGIWETMNASAPKPSWNLKVQNLEETGTQSIVTPPAGATYKFINSGGDIGAWVQTDLATKPTRGPRDDWYSANSADMAWSDPQYIVGVAAANFDNGVGFGYWSGDGGVTWANFATIPANAKPAGNATQAANIVVTARNKAVWAPSNAVPSYTTDNGASWTMTNLPMPNVVDGWHNGYRLAADRKNPNKVYAYDAGGAFWAPRGKVYVSTDGGHTFTLSQGSVAAKMAPCAWSFSSIMVNPNAEGDIWLTDGDTVYHSVDSGATWTKIKDFASIFIGNPWADVQGATAVTLGKAAPGAPYSAAVYVAGVINGKSGMWVSDNAGSTWTRFNDDAHQFGGFGRMAADWNTYGRVYAGGGGRGLLYSN